MKRELYMPYFENKNVTVMGLGLLGRGIGDTAFLAKVCKEVIVTDKKTEEQLASSIDLLKEYSNIRYVLGRHELSDFEGRDFVLKAAGVPYDSEYIAHAESHNVPVYMSAAYVASILMKELPNIRVIGVTGTRGKTTTTELIAHILRSAGKCVHLGGNIRGVANLPLLDEVEDDDVLLLELDSWQLQGFRDLKISPHISVFTSFMDDHLNYYKNDRENYFNDKAAIYRYQKEGDICIASPQANDEIAKRDDVAVTVPEKRHFEMRLIGEHNQVSASLSHAVAQQLGIDDVTIVDAIKTFKAVDGRLEDMGLFRGVRVFNDNNATTPDATIKALESLVSEYRTKPILITGGTDKMLPLEALEKSIQENTKSVVYLSGTGTARLTLSKDCEFELLKDCVDKAFDLAKEGDCIVFSPAFASFSKYFNNEYERNDLFVKEVQKYH